MKTLLTILFLALTVSAQQQRGMRFNGAFNQHVNHGLFWEIYWPDRPNVLAQDFAWEAWVKIYPEHTAGYVISAGYGGAHAILLGADKFMNKYRLHGNFTHLSTGKCGPNTEWVNFGTDPVLDPDTWYHIAVASVDHQLTVYLDGTPLVTQAWVGERISSACSFYDASAGILYVGGSDHQNFTGEIAQVRGWEGFSPYTGSAFTPEKTFSSSWTNGKERIESVFLADYKPRKLLIEDISGGYKGQKHPGLPHPTRPMLWR